MADPPIVDALFCIPRTGNVMQISDCVQFKKDLAPLMDSSGITGAILAPCNCAPCQHEWNCADRKTQEIVSAVAQNPKRLRGLASYDPLRIGESLRWIDDAVTHSGLVGAYAQAESCGSGLNAARMYPLYGVCSKLHCPIVLDLSSRERWAHHRQQVELIATDFPELDILLATPPHVDAASVVLLIERFPGLSFLLCSEELRVESALRECVETDGRGRMLFRSSTEGLPAAVQTALALRLSPGAQHAYLSENAERLFKYSFEAASLKN